MNGHMMQQPLLISTLLTHDRADPFAARLDHILAAVGDLHEAVGVARGTR